ncbi:hypothetical protein HDU76_004237, partial [Blyttiomyces sp. JEL0837]
MDGQLPPPPGSDNPDYGDRSEKLNNGSHNPNRLHAYPFPYPNNPTALSSGPSSTSSSGFIGAGANPQPINIAPRFPFLNPYMHQAQLYNFQQQQQQQAIHQLQQQRLLRHQQQQQQLDQQPLINPFQYPFILDTILPDAPPPYQPSSGTPVGTVSQSQPQQQQQPGLPTDLLFDELLRTATESQYNSQSQNANIDVEDYIDLATMEGTTRSSMETDWILNSDPDDGGLLMDERDVDMVDVENGSAGGAFGSNVPISTSTTESIPVVSATEVVKEAVKVKEEKVPKLRSKPVCSYCTKRKLTECIYPDQLPPPAPPKPKQPKPNNVSTLAASKSLSRYLCRCSISKNILAAGELVKLQLAEEEREKEKDSNTTTDDTMKFGIKRPNAIVDEIPILVMLFLQHYEYLPCQTVHGWSLVHGFNNVDPFLKLCVCAFGSCFMPKDVKGFDRDWYYRQARGQMMSAAEIGSIEILQGFILLGDCSFSFGKLSTAWVFTGMAARLSMALQIDVDPDLLPSHANETDLHQQIRRRCFWASFIIDRSLSSATNRPPTYPLRKYNVKAVCNDELWFAWRPFALPVPLPATNFPGTSSISGSQPPASSNASDASLFSPRSPAVSVSTSATTPTPTPTSASASTINPSQQFASNPLSEAWMLMIDLQSRMKNIPWSRSEIHRRQTTTIQETLSSTATSFSEWHPFNKSGGSETNSTSDINIPIGTYSTTTTHTPSSTINDSSTEPPGSSMHDRILAEINYYALSLPPSWHNLNNNPTALKLHLQQLPTPPWNLLLSLSNYHVCICVLYMRRTVSGTPNFFSWDLSLRKSNPYYGVAKNSAVAIAEVNLCLLERFSGLRHVHVLMMTGLRISTQVLIFFAFVTLQNVIVDGVDESTNGGNEEDREKNLMESKQFLERCFVLIGGNLKGLWLIGGVWKVAKLLAVELGNVANEIGKFCDCRIVFPDDDVGGYDDVDSQGVEVVSDVESH